MLYRSLQLVGSDLSARRFVGVNGEAEVLLHVGPIIRRVKRHQQPAAKRKERNAFHRLMAKSRRLDAAAAMGFSCDRAEDFSKVGGLRIVRLDEQSKEFTSNHLTHEDLQGMARRRGVGGTSRRVSFQC